MKLIHAAECLEALGNETRLDIFRLLVRAGHDGASVGTLQERLAIPASTLSHHLARLVRVGLVTQERQSRTLICRADYRKMDTLMTYLGDQCCGGLEDFEPEAAQSEDQRLHVPDAADPGTHSDA